MISFTLFDTRRKSIYNLKKGGKNEKIKALSKLP